MKSHQEGLESGREGNVRSFKKEGGRLGGKKEEGKISREKGEAGLWH